jgi:hypothetical protein
MPNYAFKRTAGDTTSLNQTLSARQPLNAAFVCSRPDPSPQRINISLPRNLLAEIDAYASSHGATRSGFLAEAARSATR